MSEKYNILIVDDVAANLMLLSDMIRQAGYMPRPVKSVAEAMRAVKELRPNLILLDISMPQISGFEYCEMLKRDVQTKDIPVLFISAKNDREDKLRGFEVGAADFIVRPFDAQELIMRVRSQLSNHLKKSEMEDYNQKLRMLSTEQFGKLSRFSEHGIAALAAVAALDTRRNAERDRNFCMDCRILAYALRLSEAFENRITDRMVEIIGTVAALHDIGNFSVRDEILCKDGVLTQEERELMQQHTVIGADVLGKMKNDDYENGYLRTAEEIARYHHEHFDGSGYPEHRCGEDIPLAARIATVIDVFLALQEDYSYRPAYSREESLRVMKEECSAWFDPDILEVFFKIQKQLKS